MNQKVGTGLGVIILVIVILTAGMFICYREKKLGEVPQPVVQNQIKKPTKKQAQNQLSSMDGNYVEFQGNKITLDLPPSWGDLIVPQVDENGYVLNSDYGSDNQFILAGKPGLGSEFTKMISSYNFGNKAEYQEAPSISLATYPAEFTDDDPNNDYGPLGPQTAKQKEANLQPPFDAFKQKSIANLNLSEKCFLTPDKATECANSNKRGFWWGNTDAISDRVAARYFENSTSDLRGIGYFDINGQDTPYTVNSYTIILVNPQKRILTYIYLPLQEVYLFSKTSDKYDVSQVDIEKAYSYLENPANYKNTQLEQFMTEVHGLVSSIKISDNQTVSQTVGDTSDSQTYRNDEYGFQVTVPSSLGSYKTMVEKDYGGTGVTYVHFIFPTKETMQEENFVTHEKFPGYVSLFALTAYTKDAYAKAAADCQKNPTPDCPDDKMGENNKYIFTVRPANGNAPDDLSAVQDQIMSGSLGGKLNLQTFPIN
jgi:hypothetical protein